MFGKIFTGTEPLLVAINSAKAPGTPVDHPELTLGVLATLEYPMKISLTSVRPSGARIRHTTTTQAANVSEIPSNHRLRFVISQDCAVLHPVNSELSAVVWVTEVDLKLLEGLDEAFATLFLFSRPLQQIETHLIPG